MSNPDETDQPALTRRAHAAPTSRQRLHSRRGSLVERKVVPRRTQAERRETTRKLLLEAAVKLIRDNGLSGLRTVEVANLAGVSRGALLHHFSSKHALVAAILNYVNEIALAQGTRRAQSARHSGEPIDEIIKDAQGLVFSDYFFIGVAMRVSGDDSSERLKRDAQQLMLHTQFSIEAAWLDILISSGIPRQLAGDVLALTLSVVRGFSVRMLMEKDTRKFPRLLSVWRKIVREHVAASIPKKTEKRT
jgi:AcrR family transcriptional regulator